jgi:S-DNA-T family DNA segregation ATPase FtsK/SpoIIIE
VGRTKTKTKTKEPDLNVSLQKVTEALRTMSRPIHDTVVDTWEEVEPERRIEILAVPIIAFALISFFSLISYSPDDSRLIFYGSFFDEHIHNWIGKPGALLADFIVFTFGAAGYTIPLLFLLWGINRIIHGGGESVRKIRVLGCILLLISLSSMLGILTVHSTEGVSEENLWRICGAIGFFLFGRLMEMGSMGALIVNSAMIAVALLCCTPFLFMNLYHRLALFFFPQPVDEEEFFDEDEDEDYYDEEAEGYNDYYVEEFDDEEDEQQNIYTGTDDTITLKPFREYSTALADGGFDDEDDTQLPPLNSTRKVLSLPISSDWQDDQPEEDVSARETGTPEEISLPVTDEDDAFLPTLEPDENKEIKIITQEDEPLKEVDLGVNLVTTPTQDSYQLPPLSLLNKPESIRQEVAREEIIHKSRVLEKTLRDFNIESQVVEVNYGPTITCYEIEPAPGIKISRIENLANDITRGLKAESVRIVAPIPGKGTVGVEVPNLNRSDVYLREIIACEVYQNITSKLKIGMGKTISGEPYIFDLIKAPHLLVAGATGSGKSVCINTIITSFLYNAAPHELKLLLVDPKQVELALYKDIPHLLSPVVTEPKRAGAALQWAVDEMETRYRYLKKAGVRNIKEYNKKRMAQQNGEQPETETTRILPGFLPYIVIIIDELADLMMVVRNEVEAMIARLAAMARAVGIHLVLATQRPSVDVLTGVIKNNFPARIAFQVSSTADSRTILDTKGAESLMGRGDMLLSPGGAGRPIRLQGAFINTEEVEDIVEFVKQQQQVEYVQEEFIPLDDTPATGRGASDSGDDMDDLYDDAVQCVLENDAASTSLLQRRLKIGYGRAARLLDLMEERGIVGPPRGSKPREIVLNRMSGEI